jgi:hypothetical protein
MEKMVDIVRDNNAEFLHAKKGILYYRIETKLNVYIFPIDMSNSEDIGEATFNKVEKALHLMRYINKAISNNSLIFYENNKTRRFNF